MPDKKPITITLDRERTLRFDTNAAADVEREVGKPIHEVVRDFSRTRKGAGLLHIRALFWASAKWEEPDLTIEAAGLLITHKNAAAVGLAALTAVNDFFDKNN